MPPRPPSRTGPRAGANGSMYVHPSSSPRWPRGPGFLQDPQAFTLGRAPTKPTRVCFPQGAPRRKYGPPTRTPCVSGGELKEVSSFTFDAGAGLEGLPAAFLRTRTSRIRMATAICLVLERTRIESARPGAKASKTAKYFWPLHDTASRGRLEATVPHSTRMHVYAVDCQGIVATDANAYDYPLSPPPVPHRCVQNVEKNHRQNC